MALRDQTVERAAVLPASEITTLLEVDPVTGLSGDEAARRLASDGPNELVGEPPEPLWRAILRQFQDPLVHLLLVAIAISVVAWWVEGTHGLPMDALVISAIVILNALIGLVQENRARDAVAALATMTAATSTVLRDGHPLSLPSSQLVRGDVLLLSEGDAVGADARVLEATRLRLQEASLTGESAPVSKSATALSELGDLGDRSSMVFKGTAVVQGVGRAVVTATGMDTQVGSIARLLDETTTDPSPLEREVAQISRMLGIVVLGIAAVVMAALFLLQRPDDLGEAVAILLLGVSLAVAAVPEGLPAILSLVLALGVQRLATRQAVMKELRSVETLGSASVICSDKTGTLTRNEMTLHRIITASGEVELSGVGYDPEGAALAQVDEATLHEASLVVAGGATANNAHLASVEGDWQITGDPTEAAFLVAVRKLPGAGSRIGSHRLAELPFSSERKMMSVLVADPDGTHRIVTKGAPDVLLDHCRWQQVGTGRRPLDEAARERVLHAVERLSAQGNRTLAVAERLVEGPLTSADGSPASLAGGEAPHFEDEHEEDLTFLGVVGIIDPPREEARQAVQEAHDAGVRVVMITGDHPSTAHSIARDLGIIAADHEGPRVLTGAQLDALDDAQLRELVTTVPVYARVAPAHKLRVVDALQSHRHVVAMTGDGVNDAPALKSADIGVAMGITGTEVTKQAGAMILADDNFATIVQAVRLGRGIFDNIRKFLRYLLSSNMGEVATVFFGIVLAGVIGLQDASPTGALVVPLLASQILWINLVTDSGPALAMGIDPDDGDVMARPPRRATDRIITGGMWLRIIATGLVMGALTLTTLDLMLPGGLIEGAESLDTARTAAFTTLVLAQLFNALNARSDRHSALRGLFSNHWLWVSIGVAVVAQVAVVHLPVLQTAFGTTDLDLGQWLTCVAMASVVLVVVELGKAVRRRLPPAAQR